MAKETYLVVMAMGEDRPGLVEELAGSVDEAGCRLGESRMAVLGSEFALVAEIAGHWNAVAKLESALPRLGADLGLRLETKRTTPSAARARLIPYAIEVIAAERPGIVREVAGFFAERGINIEDLHASPYPAPQTGAAMFSLHLTVGLPADASIAAVRGEFMDFCDDLNLDGMMAPVK